MENKENMENKESIPEQIKVIREEFETQIVSQKAEYEKTIADLKKSHIEEIKALAMGHKTTSKSEGNDEDEDEDEEAKAVKNITEKLKKRYK